MPHAVPNLSDDIGSDKDTEIKDESHCKESDSKTETKYASFLCLYVLSPISAYYTLSDVNLHTAPPARIWLTTIVDHELIYHFLNPWIILFAENINHCKASECSFTYGRVFIL